MRSQIILQSIYIPAWMSESYNFSCNRKHWRIFMQFNLLNPESDLVMRIKDGTTQENLNFDLRDEGLTTVFSVVIAAKMSL